MELGLLLHDALFPERPVPLESARTAARQHYAGPQPSQRLLQELEQKAAAAKDRAEGDEEGGEGEGEGEGEAGAEAGGGQPGPSPSGPAGPGSATSALSAPMDVDSRPPAATERLPMLDDGGSRSPAPAAPPPAMTTAGARAERMLPACLALLEAAVGVMAADAALGDDVMDVDAAVAPGGGSLLPCLPEAALQRLMSTIGSAVDLLLEFLGAACPLELRPAPGERAAGAIGKADNEDDDDAAAGPPVDVPAPLLLAATRALGRYYAEAPTALGSGKALGLLPFAVGLQDGDGEDAGFGLGFLLPGLLQATSQGCECRAQVRQTLLASPHALGAIVSYLCHCCGAAAEAAQRAAPLRPVAAVAGRPHTHMSAPMAMAAGRQQLLADERALADVSTLILNTLEPAGLAALLLQRQAACAAMPAGAGAAAAAAAAQAPVVAQQLLPALHSIAAWAAARAACWEALRGFAAPPQQEQVLRMLAGFGLTPRALLCTTCAAAVVLAAATRSGLGGAAGPQPDGVAAGAGAAPELCSALVAAVQAGSCLVLWLEMEERQDLRHAGGAAADGGGDGQGAFSVEEVAADFVGDAEEAWERLCELEAELLESHHGSLRAAVARWGPALGALATASAAPGGEGDTLRACVSLQLLLQAAQRATARGDC